METHDTDEFAAEPALFTILVISSRYRSYCLPLARAATLSGKRVCVHFLHQGMARLDKDLMARLQRWAQVSVSRESAPDSIGSAPHPYADLMVPPDHEVDLIRTSQRVVTL